MTPNRAFITQKSDAKKRGVSWQLDFSQWWSIWKQSGHWEKRGRGADTYCMCRKGDVGPYSAENVFIGPSRENSSKTPWKKKPFPMGVYKAYSGSGFSAQRRIDGKKVHLGTYTTPALAGAAYLASINGG